MAKKWGKPPVDIEGNKPAPMGDCSHAVKLASNWIVAIDAWDYCDPSILQAMLRRHPVPFELQPVLADIISGERPQNKKGADKLKIPAGHRMIVAGIYAELKEGVIDATLARKSIPDYHATADNLGIEVADYRRKIQTKARKFKKDVADSAGIGTQTLENLYSDLREKIKNYPNI